MSGPRPTAPAAVLRRALLVTLGFAVVEAVGGWWTGSLALLGDAGHMLTDAAGLGLALVASRLSALGPSRRFTYGLGRVEVVAAVVNGLVLTGVALWIAVEAVGRLADPPPVRGGVALLVAAAGCAVNVYVARTLQGGERTINVRAAFLHVLGDLLGSVAALVSAGVVLVTGWLGIDPLLSFLLAALILLSALRVLREGLRILLEGVPAHLSLEEVGAAMAAVPGVVSVHDLHVWQLSSLETALSAHVVVADVAAWEATLGAVRLRLLEGFEIGHATLQPERAGAEGAPVRLEGTPPSA